MQQLMKPLLDGREPPMCSSKTEPVSTLRCTAASQLLLEALRHLCFLVQEDGSGQQLITPPLDGTILPGVTRDSVLQLARHWWDCDVLEAHITVGALKRVRCPLFVVYNRPNAVSAQLLALKLRTVVRLFSGLGPQQSVVAP